MKILSPSFEIYNIRTALLLFVLAPFLLIMMFTGWYSLHNLEAQVKKRMQEDIELIARAIQLPLSYALEHGHSGSLEQTLTSAFDFGRVYGVYVYDESGQRIAASGSRKALVRTEKAAVLALKGDDQSEFEIIGDEEVFSYFLPLTDSGERISGLLQVTRRGSDFVDYIGKLRFQALSLLAVFVLLLIAVVYIGHHNAIGRYMKNIQSSMRRISSGDLQHRIALRGPSEIRFLADGINTMLNSIAHSEKKIEQQREKEIKLKARLHQSEKLAAIGQFAAGVAHELGTPLSVADGKAQQSLRKKPPDATPVLTQIRAELQRMEHIIRQLMDFARPVTPEHRAIAADHLARSSLAHIDDERRHFRVDIKLTGIEPAPVLIGDRLRLEQALTNLLRNAIQANPGGHIELGWSHDDKGVRFSVDDDGPGIDSDIESHVFDPFFTTKPTGQGAGLGLAVVAAVMNEHDGYVQLVRSSLGGAKFILQFPDNLTTEHVNQ